jgi:hypothetical protein
MTRALTPYQDDFNHCRTCTPPFEDGLKESPKPLGQKKIDKRIKKICITLVITQFHSKMLGPCNIKYS